MEIFEDGGDRLLFREVGDPLEEQLAAPLALQLCGELGGTEARVERDGEQWRQQLDAFLDDDAGRGQRRFEPSEALAADGRHATGRRSRHRRPTRPTGRRRAAAPLERRLGERLEADLALQVVDDRRERRVRLVADAAERKVARASLVAHSFDLGDQARLADARLTEQQHDLAIAAVPADCARDLLHDAPRMHWVGNTPQRLRAEVDELEGTAHQPMGGGGDDGVTGIGDRLQARRDVGRDPHREVLLAPLVADHAHHHQPGVDADARAEADAESLLCLAALFGE